MRIKLVVREKIQGENLVIHGVDMKIYDIINDLNIDEEALELTKGSYWIMCDAEEIKKLKLKLGLDNESILECLDFKKVSKIEFYEKYLFLVFNVLVNNNGRIQSRELNIFLSKNYIVTVSKEKIELIEKLIGNIKDLKNCFMLKNNAVPSVVLYYILDRIIINNYNIISELEAEADKIEINILKDPKHEQIDELIHLRRQVYKTRKYLSPLRYIGDSLVSNENEIIERENIKLFMSINNKIDKLMVALDILVQGLGLVREAFESEIANKTNELMKVFTIIATIFLPLNLITSMYGMNFKGLPFVDCEHGYYYMLIFMACTAGILILIFKNKKWL